MIIKESTINNTTIIQIDPLTMTEQLTNALDQTSEFTKAFLKANDSETGTKIKAVATTIASLAVYLYAAGLFTKDVLAKLYGEFRNAYAKYHAQFTKWHGAWVGDPFADLEPVAVTAPAPAKRPMPVVPPTPVKMEEVVTTEKAEPIAVAPTVKSVEAPTPRRRRRGRKAAAVGFS